ncbi:Aste57867_25022 [Aphanomyces stellatus]|uniref:Aste57867_25022 protein n=1 Tax=Aphanomyces stellatus TaxID=120398 RepID=A0A485LS20_9STRA|nr:hypothetical protein As57867_024944 [Aphanomyces stellatus]VFU01653.1 Aste57867_25022 [Aphanomyces stellatus]
MTTSRHVTRRFDGRRVDAPSAPPAPLAVAKSVLPENVAPLVSRRPAPRRRLAPARLKSRFLKIVPPKAFDATAHVMQTLFDLAWIDGRATSMDGLSALPSTPAPLDVFELAFDVLLYRQPLGHQLVPPLRRLGQKLTAAPCHAMSINSATSWRPRARSAGLTSSRSPTTSSHSSGSFRPRRHAVRVDAATTHGWPHETSQHMRHLGHRAREMDLVPRESVLELLSDDRFDAFFAQVFEAWQATDVPRGVRGRNVGWADGTVPVTVATAAWAKTASSSSSHKRRKRTRTE